MRESKFQQEWIDSWYFHYPECHAIKIPDMPRASGARFIPFKPYDCYALVRGKFFAMELKLKTKISAFPFKEVTESQVHNLERAFYNGAKAYVVVNYRTMKISAKAKKEYGYDNDEIDIALCMDIRQFIELDSLAIKSIPFKEMLHYSTIVEKKDDFYEVNKLVNK